MLYFDLYALCTFCRLRRNFLLANILAQQLKFYIYRVLKKIIYNILFPNNDSYIHVCHRPFEVNAELAFVEIDYIHLRACYAMLSCVEITLVQHEQRAPTHLNDRIVRSPHSANCGLGARLECVFASIVML